MSYRLQDAEPKHIAAMVQLHIQCWRENFRGLVPDEALDKIDAAEWIERRRRQFERVAGTRIVAFDASGKLAGFVDGGPSLDARYRSAAEIYRLFIAVSEQGQGLGRSLLQEILGRFRGQGYQQMIVKTFRDNPHSRGFYERLGGQVQPLSSEFEFYGARYPESIYLFDLDPASMRRGPEVSL